MKTFLIVLFFSSVFKFNSEKCNEFVICEIASNKVISFPIIKYFKNGEMSGQYADINGRVCIDEVLDSIAISCVGYHSKIIYNLRDRPDTIYLEPSTTFLDEVIVKSPRKNIIHTLGFPSKKSFKLGVLPDTEMGVIIKSTEGDTGLVSKIRLPIINKNKNVIRYFRIRFYENNRGKPGNEIQIENKIYQVDSKKYQEIDIQSEAIRFTPRGIFVAIEVLNEEYESNLDSGTKLFVTKKGAKSQTYFRGLTSYQWEKLILPIDNEVNLCIELEVIK